MSNSRTLTCVYCGMAYPQDTPAWGSDVLTDHIRTCPKHPLRKAEDDIATLREALAALVGAESVEEARLIESVYRVMPASAERTLGLRAIGALLDTWPLPAKAAPAAPREGGEESKT